MLSKALSQAGSARQSFLLALVSLVTLMGCSGSSSSGPVADADSDGDAGDTGSDVADGGGDGDLSPDAPEPTGEVVCRAEVDVTRTVDLSGTLACESCQTAVTLWLYDNAFLEGEPTCAVSLPWAEAFAVQVPAELGLTYLFGFGDDTGLGTLDPGEPFGGAEPNPIEIAGADLADVHLELVAPEPPPEELGGAIDEFGDAITPDRLLARFAPGTSEDDAAAAIEAHGGELSSWLEAIETAVIAVDLPAEQSDETLLEPLRALEAALLDDPLVETVFRDYRYGRADTRSQTEDYLALTAAQQSAYSIIDLATAKEVFDQCSYHLEPAERSVSVVVATIDTDLLGAQSATELAGLTTSLQDLHEHIDREFCGRTPGGFQRLCEPSTTNDHGSAVTSVIGGLNNSAGMNGVLTGFAGTTPGGAAYSLSYGFRLFNVGYGPSFSASEALNAMQAAAQSDAQVINMSWGMSLRPAHNVRGWSATYRSFTRLINGFTSKVWVMSAGNDGSNLTAGTGWSGLSAPHLVIVGATDANDNRSIWGPASSAFGLGIVDLAAPGTGVYAASVNVLHSGTSLHPSVSTTVSTNQAYGLSNGTSLSAPLVTGAMAYLRAFEPSVQPADLVRRLRNAGDIAPNQLGGRRLNMGRTVVAHRAGAINSTNTHLLSFSGDVTSVTGAGCPIAPTVGHECVPVRRSGGSLDSPPGIADVNGNEYVLRGTIDGANNVSLTISGFGISAGVGPATTTYQGVATVDPSNAANLIVTGGSFTAQTRTSAGAPADCDYAGTFEATFRGIARP